MLEHCAGLIHNSRQTRVIHEKRCQQSWAAIDQLASTEALRQRINRKQSKRERDPLWNTYLLIFLIALIFSSLLLLTPLVRAPGL